jgi:hypothetical protein
VWVIGKTEGRSKKAKRKSQSSRFCFHIIDRTGIPISRQYFYRGIIADNLHNTGWSLGWVSAINREGRTIWIADAHRGDGKR